MEETAFRNKLNDLERRISSVDSSDCCSTKLNLSISSYGSPKRPKPLGDFGACSGTPPKPGSAPVRRRTRPGFNLPVASPQYQHHHRPPDSEQIDQKYQDIMRLAGILRINDKEEATSLTDLQPICELGHGTCGLVMKMQHKKSGHIMAVKQMRRSGNREENKRIIMDLDVVLKSHDCPFIVYCLGTIITKSGDVWICMELMSTCLEKLLKRTGRSIPERILGKVAIATVKALHYLKEEHGVIHRDVKPSNILLDEKGQIKLCDFGISGRLVDSKAKTRSAGCAAYMAPERIDPPDPTRPDYDIRADVWSIGITLVELATGEFPYSNCKTDFEVLTKVLQEDPPTLPPHRGFSINFCMFIKDCLTKDYKKRPKYKKLLEHPFIKRSEALLVNVAAWYCDAVANTETPQQTPSITPSSPFAFEFSPNTTPTPTNNVHFNHFKMDPY